MKEKVWKAIFGISFIPLSGFLLILLIDIVMRVGWRELLLKVDILNNIDPKILAGILIGGTIGSRISFKQLLKINDYYEGKLRFISNWNRSFILWSSGIGIFVASFLVNLATSVAKSKSSIPNPYFGFGVSIVFWTTLSTFLLGIVFLKKASLEAARGNFYHGSARFANAKEIEEITIGLNEAMPAGGFFLSSNKKGAIILPRMEAVKHGLILGGSGTGKSRGYFLPNCAWSQNTSLVVTDPKSELWRYTSGFHNSLRYSPTEPENSECFNWIPLCQDARMAQLCARAIMEAGGNGKTDPFWLEAETSFLSALFAHTATLGEPTPLTAYRLFSRQRPEVLLEQLINSQSEIAREEAIIFSQTDPRIKGGIVPAIASKLQFLRDPKIARFTSASLEAPDFGMLRIEPMAVYYCMKEQDISRLKPLTSLFFTVLLEQIAGEEIAEGMEEVPINMMMDEFANIGVIPDFATTISLARGRGVGIWLGIQSLSQLEANYGRANAQTIVTNCSTKVALHGLDYQTASYISNMLGDTTVVVPRISYNDGGGTLNVMLGKGHSSNTYSQSEHKRPLMTPDEVMRLGNDQAIVRSGNKYPMILWKIYYNAPESPARPRLLGAAKALELTPQVLNNNSNLGFNQPSNNSREGTIVSSRRDVVEPPEMPDLD